MLSCNSKVNSQLHLSLAGILDRVMCQVEFDCFADLRFHRIDPLYKELCLIISEVFILRSESIVKINGVDMEISLIQEVFERLRHEHVRLVSDNFQELSYHVYNKKAYLRTALYNAVFEIESYDINRSNFD